MGFLSGYARRLGVLEYRGTWNAATNTPSLSSGSGARGAYYIVSHSGTTILDGDGDWNPGDWVVFNGTTWEKIDNTDKVTSVNGMTGDVVISTDYAPTVQKITLTQSNIDNGYVDLAGGISGTPQIYLYPDRSQLLPTEDFTTSGARITFVSGSTAKGGEDALVAGDILAVYYYSLSPQHERFVLTSTDISNGYIDVLHNISGQPVIAIYPWRLQLMPDDDFSVIENRIIWDTETVGPGGAEALVAGDVVHVYYFKEQ